MTLILGSSNQLQLKDFDVNFLETIGKSGFKSSILQSINTHLCSIVVIGMGEKREKLNILMGYAVNREPCCSKELKRGSLNKKTSLFCNKMQEVLLEML